MTEFVRGNPNHRTRRPFSQFALADVPPGRRQQREQQQQARPGVGRAAALIVDLTLPGMRAYAGLRSLPLEAGERLLADQTVVLVDDLLAHDSERR